MDATRDAVDGWRAEQQQALERGMRDLEERLLASLGEELGQLRRAAKELLDLDLVTEEDRPRLVEDPRLFYLPVEDIGQTELLAGAIRRAPARRAEPTPGRGVPAG